MEMQPKDQRGHEMTTSLHCWLRLVLGYRRRQRRCRRLFVRGFLWAGQGGVQKTFSEFSLQHALFCACVFDSQPKPRCLPSLLAS